MRVPTCQGIYAVGDIVSLPGPKLAYSAIEQAKVASANIVSEINGEKPREYYYHEIARLLTQAAPNLYTFIMESGMRAFTK